MKTKRKLIVLISVVLFFVLCFLFYRERQQILKQPVTAWTTDHKADCAVVLTGGPGRVREGFNLLSQKQIKKLIISGVYPGAKLREVFPAWPFYGAPQTENIILEKRSRTTYGNAAQSLPLIEALNCRDIVLITSRLHMHRASKIFKSVFPQNFPIYPRSLVYDDYHPSFYDLSYESIKAVFYSLWAY